MDYQSYILCDESSQTLKELIKTHQKALTEHYKEMTKLAEEFGANSAISYNHHHVSGFSFNENVPKGWKKVKNHYIPTKKALLKKIEDLNQSCPHPYPVFGYLQWQSFLVDGVQLDPEIRFIGDVAVLSHPVFLEGKMNSLDLFKDDELEEITTNGLMRLRISRGV
jgi:hypothetical protein